MMNDFSTSDIHSDHLLEESKSEYDHAQKSAKEFMEYQGYDKFYNLDVEVSERIHSHSDEAVNIISNNSPGQDSAQGLSNIATNLVETINVDNKDAVQEDLSEAIEFGQEALMQTLADCVGGT